MDAAIAGHKNAEVIVVEGLFGKARSVTHTLQERKHELVTGWSVHSEALPNTDQPFMRCPRWTS